MQAAKTVLHLSGGDLEEPSSTIADQIIEIWRAMFGILCRKYSKVRRWLLCRVQVVQ